MPRAIFNALHGEELNLTIYNNGSNSKMIEGDWKVKLNKHINENQRLKEGNYRWMETNSSGSSRINKAPGLDAQGWFNFFAPAGNSSSGGSSNNLKKRASPYHPHKDKQDW